MDITVNKSEIYKAVKMNVSIIARSMKDQTGNSLFDKVRIQDRDEDLLDLFWHSAFGNVLAEMKKFVSGVNGTTISLFNDRRINEPVASDLPQVISDYITNQMAAEWLKLKAPEYAPAYVEHAAMDMKSILGKLYDKTEPVMKTFD